MTTRRRITIERTHAAPIEDVWDLWTQRAVMGWESQLGKLAKILENRSTTSQRA